jgi:hypothetical protein
VQWGARVDDGGAHGSVTQHVGRQRDAEHDL